MENFTPWSALAGGALIGLSATFLMLTHGRVAGISGIFGGLLNPKRGEVGWRAAFVGGLVAGGILMSLLAPSLFGGPLVGLGFVAAAGLLVGVGTRIGNGCTSGHGVCGIARFSPRSLMATVTFIATGVATVAALRATGVLS